jgi:hypothetical protein
MLQSVRDSLTKASVAQGTIDQALKQAANALAAVEEWTGFVSSIVTDPTVVLAIVQSSGTKNIQVSWPPNDARYLAEFIRAQNNRLGITVYYDPGTNLISNVMVEAERPGEAVLG